MLPTPTPSSSTTFKHRTLPSVDKEHFKYNIYFFVFKYLIFLELQKFSNLEMKDSFRGLDLELMSVKHINKLK